MMDAKKVHMMTKLALFEKKETRHALKIARYQERDYVRMQMWKMLVSVTVGYLCILILLAISQAEYLMNNATTLDYKEMFEIGIVVYIGVCLVYLILGLIYYLHNYRMARKHVKEYDRLLHRLRGYYRKKRVAE